MNEERTSPEINRLWKFAKSKRFDELEEGVARRTRGRGYLAAVRLWETPDSCVTYSREMKEP